MADEQDPKATEATEEEPLFDASLKKKKKKKAVAFDPLDVPYDPTDSTPAAASSTPAKEDATPASESTPAPVAVDNDDLDFGDLKRKKKKKTVMLDLDDGEKGSGAATPAEDGGEEFADLKKKKKGKKGALDLEAFERELDAAGGEGTPAAGSDDEAVANEDAPEDGLFGGGDEDGAAVEEKSKALTAAEKKAWLKEPERDYKYDELLGRFYQALHVSHPSLSGGAGKKRYTLAPPSVHREGNKRSIWSNVAEICKKMHRQPEHVVQFLFSELGTSGSVDGNSNLVIKGRFQQKQIENVLRRYIVEYVTCKTCKSPDTLLEKDQRLVFMTCESCGSKRSVSAIKQGFSAQIGRRKAQKA